MNDFHMKISQFMVYDFIQVDIIKMCMAPSYVVDICIANYINVEKVAYFSFPKIVRGVIKHPRGVMEGSNGTPFKKFKHP